MSRRPPTDGRRLRALAPPAHAWVPLEPGTGLPAMLSRLAPDERTWTVRLEGPADQIRYLLELAAAEGVEAHPAPVGRGAELTLPAAHPLVATLLTASEAPDCTVVVLAGDHAGVAVEGRTRAGPQARRRWRRGLPAGAAVLLVAAAAVWAPAPPLTGPDPRLQLGSAPPSLAQAASAIDGRSGELVVFGGIATTAPGVDLGATWTRDAGTWRLRRPPVSPPARFGAVMADDPGSGRVILFGGLRRTPVHEDLEDTWAWDGASWRRLTTVRTPPPDAVARGLAWEAAAHTLVLVTVRPGEAQTWTWDGGGWFLHPGVTTPQVAWMAPAPDGAVIGVGFPDPDNRGATWRWDGNSWKRLAPATEVAVDPLSALLAYDSTTRRTLLVEVEFQGADGADAGGTWSWDGVDWTEHHSVPAVVGAFGVTQPVVAAERPLTLLGGPQDSGAYRDSWTWDGSAWRRS